MKEKQPQNNNRLLLQYAGLTFQVMVGLAIGVYAGYWLDQHLHTGFPLLVWLLPLIVLTALIIKVISDTNKK